MIVKTLYDGWHKVIQIQSAIKDRFVLREKIIMPSAVSVVLIDENNKVAIVRQYRPCIGGISRELPAGVMDKDKSHTVTILEEIQEECNVDPSRVKILSELYDFYINIGSSDARTKVYMAIYHGTGVDQDVDDSDVESVTWYSADIIRQMLDNRMFKDPKTLLGLRVYLDYFERR